MTSESAPNLDGNNPLSVDPSGSNNTNDKTSTSTTSPQQTKSLSAKQRLESVGTRLKEGLESGKRIATESATKFKQTVFRNPRYDNSDKQNKEKPAILQGAYHDVIQRRGITKDIFISVAILCVIILVIFMSIYMRMNSEGIKKNSETIENIVEQIEESKEDQKQETQPEKKSYIEEYILVGALVSLIIYFYFFQDSGTVVASKKSKK